MSEEGPGRIPTWLEIRERLRLKEPHPISVSEQPLVVAVIEPALGTVGLVADASPGTPGRTYRPAKGIRVQPQGAGNLVAIWVEDRELAELGWRLLAAVAERVVRGQSVFDALEAELERWRALVAMLGTTTTSAALGALGELAVFRSALAAKHDLSCWVGLEGGAIDFRFGSLECEVKTTSGERHEHIINGSEQLQPSIGNRLVLLSLVVAATEAGAGSSVVQLVSDAVALGASRERLEHSLLIRRQVRLGDPATETGYVLRGRPLVVAVGDSFPALTASALRQMLGVEAGRIRDLTYRLDLEGLPAALDLDLHAVESGVEL